MFLYLFCRLSPFVQSEFTRIILPEFSRFLMKQAYVRIFLVKGDSHLSKFRYSKGATVCYNNVMQNTFKQTEISKQKYRKASRRTLLYFKTFPIQHCGLSYKETSATVLFFFILTYTDIIFLKFRTKFNSIIYLQQFTNLDKY